MTYLHTKENIVQNGLSTNKSKIQKGSEGQMEEREIPAGSTDQS